MRRWWGRSPRRFGGLLVVVLGTAAVTGGSVGVAASTRAALADIRLADIQQPVVQQAVVQQAVVQQAVVREGECDRDRVVLIAHRGTGPGTRFVDGRSYSEDTVAAFRRAMDSHADGFETDYWPSRDGVVVSHHDPTLARMTNGSGRIGDRSWRYIRDLRNTSGARVPSLRQVQRALLPYRGHRQQEIKDGWAFTNSQLRRMIESDRRTVTRMSQVLVTSSQVRTLRRLRAIDARVPLGLIAPQTRRPVIADVPRWVDVLLVHFEAASRPWVARAHGAGFKVSVREVNSRERFRNAVAMGADRIITDRPELLGDVC